MAHQIRISEVLDLFLSDYKCLIKLIFDIRVRQIIRIYHLLSLFMTNQMANYCYQTFNGASTCGLRGRNRISGSILFQLSSHLLPFFLI